MKTCFKCGVEKPLTEFYKHGAMADGHLGKCKTCAKADVKARYDTNPEKVKEYERKRANLPHRVTARREYASSKQGRPLSAPPRKRVVFTSPMKRAATVILGNAVRDKKVIKPYVCQECGTGGRIQGHHHDYTKPLDVEWLCIPCHNKRHWCEQEESNTSRGA